MPHRDLERDHVDPKRRNVASETGAVLFLQPNSSPLVRMVRRKLRSLDVTTLGIAFCAGDRLLWSGKPVVSYRGKPEHWPAFVRSAIERNRVADIVLFGKDRPYHAAAIAVAHEMGVRVHALDEGFMRPNWITLEDVSAPGGPRIPHLGSAGTPLDPRRPTVAIGTSFRRRAAWDALFHTLNIVLQPFYPFYRSHRRGSQLLEGLGHVRKGVARPLRRRRARAVEEGLRDGTPYFLVPMQLDNDFQIRKHSPFDSMKEVLELVFASFSRAAPADAVLVAKLHPLDAHVVDYHRVVRGLARRHSIEKRVLFVDGGDLRAMIEGAHGVVTVNSTAGLWALRLGRPVKALARPLYDRPGLTDPKTLDEFWRDPRAPSDEAVTWFVDHMRASMQVNGGYFTDEGLALAADGIVRRLLHARSGGARDHEARVDAAEGERIR